MEANRLIFIFACLWVTLFCSPMQSASEAGPKVAFRWTFAVFRGGGESAKLFSLSGDSALHSGDRIKLYVEKIEPCYIYWIYLDTLYRIQLLFPAEATDPERSKPDRGEVFIPAATQWYRLDSRIGKERFYLIASTDPLVRLEALFADLAEAGRPQPPSLVKSILDEIRTLRWKHRNFKRAAERPPPIMGQVRNGDAVSQPDHEQIRQMATTVRTEIFFAKVFTIDHQ